MNTDLEKNRDISHIKKSNTSHNFWEKFYIFKKECDVLIM